MGKSKKQNLVIVHNKVSNNFRELHVDGAYGGLTVNGLYNINFYAERQPIPKSTEFQVPPDKNTLIRVKDSDDSKTGLIREFEFGIYMTLAAAKELHRWLGENINTYETLKEKKK